MPDTPTTRPEATIHVRHGHCTTLTFGGIAYKPRGVAPTVRTGDKCRVAVTVDGYLRLSVNPDAPNGHTATFAAIEPGTAGEPLTDETEILEAAEVPEQRARVAVELPPDPTPSPAPTPAPENTGAAWGDIPSHAPVSAPPSPAEPTPAPSPPESTPNPVVDALAHVGPGDGFAPLPITADMDSAHLFDAGIRDNAGAPVTVACLVRTVIDVLNPGATVLDRGRVTALNIDGTVTVAWPGGSERTHAPGELRVLSSPR